MAAEPVATAAELATAARLGYSTVGKTLAWLERAGRVTRSPGGYGQGGRQPDRWSVVAEPAGGGTPQLPGEGATRLGRGELRARVLAYLREWPGQEHTLTAVARALGRSQGAVGNALARLAADGTVAQTSAKPRRYAAPRAPGRDADTRSGEVGA